ncbi:MAG TPA: MogA/MoaB family molybdenum cofactor biosynthesis protein [Anaerolineales bacterium]|nr:MogA/MoaB family molybdenum cofactor biosynthesis protein [Anaerolineales bacterium]
MSLRFGVLTISDRVSRGERADASGPALVKRITAESWEVARQGVVLDDLPTIRQVLLDWADRGDLDIILTTGGTGFAPRDVTPEATRMVIDRDAPGLAEAMRAASAAKSRHAMLSRAVAGVRGRVLIINLPGSPKAAVENFETVLPVLVHAVQLLHEDPAAESGH